MSVNTHPLRKMNRGTALETGQSLLEDPHLASWPLHSSHPLFESRPSLGDRKVTEPTKVFPHLHVRIWGMLPHKIDLTARDCSVLVPCLILTG